MRKGINESGDDMRRLLLILLMLITIFIIVLVYRQMENPLNKIKNYRVFYGRPGDDYQEAFLAYDLLVLEPAFYSKQEIGVLKDQGKQLYLGYLTVFEVSHWDEELLSLVKREDYLHIDGAPYKKEGRSNYLGDIRNASYRQVLLKLVEERIQENGYHGVFLDTVDWIDYFNYDDQVLTQELLDGYEIFIKNLRSTFPDLLIVQNRGFLPYKNFSKKYVDGIMWENFNYDTIFTKNIQITLDLIRAKWLRGNQVLTISHDAYDKNRQLSEKLHWVFMPSYGSYSEWPNP